jgi:hypothetical protein
LIQKEDKKIISMATTTTAQETELQQVAQTLLQAADTLLQLSDHIYKKRKLEDLVLETNSDFVQLQTAMRRQKRQHDAYKASLAVPMPAVSVPMSAVPVPMPALTVSVPAHALPKYVAVPEHEWTKMCVYSSKMVHLICHQQKLLQTFLPGKSDTEIVIQAMSECKCVKTRM